MLKFTKDRKEQALKMQKRHKIPVWEGPESDGKNGGVTQSLLSRFLVCRERFRLLVVEGLKPRDVFNHRLGYGTMFHLCMETLANGEQWDDALNHHSQDLVRQYPLQRDEIEKWWNVCRIQFPIYAEWWANHPSTKPQAFLMSEQEFNVPYKLPSGRTVRLRGKWDGVNLVGKGKEAGIWLVEHKTKGEIDERQIVRQLNFDIQTMLYIVALYQDYPKLVARSKVHELVECYAGRLDLKIKGVIYNVIRRPLSGGKGTIVRHKGSKGSKCSMCKNNPAYTPVCSKCIGRGRIGGKPEESWDSYWGRVEQYIKDDPKSYFMRWNVEVGSGDVAKFSHECLDPILEQLCDWWGCIVCEPIHKSNIKEYRGLELRGDPFWSSVDVEGNFVSPVNWRMPFGVYNPLLEGNPTDMDDHLATGGTAGLQRTTNLFPELNG